MDPSGPAEATLEGPQATQKHKLVDLGPPNWAGIHEPGEIDYGSTAASARFPSQGPRPPPLPRPLLRAVSPDQTYTAGLSTGAWFLEHNCSLLTPCFPWCTLPRTQSPL